MRHAHPDAGVLLTPHRVGPDTPQVIAQRLQQTGLVVLDGLSSRAAVLDLASRIMTVTPHRDSDTDGLTTLRNTGQHAQRPGFAGFTGAELAPHTERAGTPAPPRLMLLVCGRPAESGGECLLTDGRSVHTDLFTGHPKAAHALSQPRTAFFGAGDGAGHPTQVFTACPGGRLAMRLRLDGLARWSPLTQPYLPELQAAATAHQLRLRLTAGQGYLLDNTRWLHARAVNGG
ncbi:TauD/TfdA family dioxygenase [Actinomadura roseirufa]|uniref:TauD/TfdA family dioxygenase n=1 Tax=Actinomadura roseirufa TaxID=2094049 RepID=UPI0010419A55|nr:TauD/TfdA family dioxygenase [Actinomadura roseirufa]